MGKDNRVTLRRRSPYNTRSNKRKLVRTPGGKLAVLYTEKKAKGPMCGDCGRSLPGIPHLRPRQYAKIPKRMKSVSRAYGGSRCAGCVKERIVRAFMVEEQKIVKSVLKTEQAKKTKETKK